MICQLKKVAVIIVMQRKVSKDSLECRNASSLIFFFFFPFTGISALVLQDWLFFFFSSPSPPLKSHVAWIAVSYLLSGRENIGLSFSLPFLVTTDPAYVYLKGPAGFSTCDFPSGLVWPAAMSQPLEKQAIVLFRAGAKQSK